MTPFPHGKEHGRASGLTLDQAQAALDCDPLTGCFAWRLRSSWRVRVGERAGMPHAGGGRVIGLHRVKCMEHDLAWLFMTGEWPARRVFHLDGNKRNNVWANLRQETPREPKVRAARPAEKRPSSDEVSYKNFRWPPSSCGDA